MFNQHQPYPEDQMIAYLLVGDRQAVAYKWLQAYVESINSMDDRQVTIDELIEVALTHVNSTSSWGGDYITGSDSYEGLRTEPMFWEKLADLKQIEIKQDNRNNFFSCSC